MPKATETLWEWATLYKSGKAPINRKFTHPNAPPKMNWFPISYFQRKKPGHEWEDTRNGFPWRSTNTPINHIGMATIDLNSLLLMMECHKDSHLMGNLHNHFIKRAMFQATMWCRTIRDRAVRTVKLTFCVFLWLLKAENQ